MTCRFPPATSHTCLLESLGRCCALSRKRRGTVSGKIATGGKDFSHFVWPRQTGSSAQLSLFLFFFWCYFRHGKHRTDTSGAERVRGFVPTEVQRLPCASMPRRKMLPGQLRNCRVVSTLFFAVFSLVMGYETRPLVGLDLVEDRTTEMMESIKADMVRAL